MRPDDRKKALEWAANEAQQIADVALTVATKVNYDQKVDPTFVAAVMATITTLYVDATKPRQPPGAG